MGRGLENHPHPKWRPSEGVLRRHGGFRAAHMNLPLDVHKSSGASPAVGREPALTRARASPFSTTTASPQVAHVQRSLHPTAHSIPSKSSSPRSGEAGGPFSIGGAFVRSAGTCRSMFTRERASPFSTTTASSQVAHVQRSLPSSARSAVTISLSVNLVVPLFAYRLQLRHNALPHAWIGLGSPACP